MVGYPVKQIQTQIPPQSHIGLDALFNLPFRWDSVQVSYQQILHQHHWVDGWAAPGPLTGWLGSVTPPTLNVV